MLQVLGAKYSFGKHLFGTTSYEALPTSISMRGSQKKRVIHIYIVKRYPFITENSPRTRVRQPKMSTRKVQ